jgi:hypothetical protein
MAGGEEKSQVPNDVWFKPFQKSPLPLQGTVLRFFDEVFNAGKKIRYKVRLLVQCTIFDDSTAKKYHLTNTPLQNKKLRYKNKK